MLRIQNKKQMKTKYENARKFGNQRIIKVTNNCALEIQCEIKAEKFSHTKNRKLANWWLKDEASIQYEFCFCFSP